jgi:hypothetical protein
LFLLKGSLFFACSHKSIGSSPISMETYLSKWAVGGLKLSEELIQISLSPKRDQSVEAMFQRLTDRHINLTGVTLEAIKGQLKGWCCILSEDRAAAEEALQSFAGSFAMRLSVGSLTVFPHQSRLELLGHLLSVLGHYGIPIYGVASSFSSLVITTDYGRLDDAVRAVCQVVTLPENHAPFRPEFRVNQV